MLNGYYWVYFVTLAMMLLYELKVQAESKRLIYHSAWAFLILIFVVQDFSVSIDIAEYMRQYYIIPRLTFGEMLTHKFEIGFVSLSRLIAYLFQSERMLLLVVSLIILVPFSQSYERETEDPMVSLMAFVALGMYLHSLYFWRQLMAMAILTYSYRYIRQCRLIQFLLIVLGAMCFHKVSIVFIPMYFLYKVPINKWLLVCGAACSALTWIFGRTIIELGIKIVYPGYSHHIREALGGETLFALLWVITLLSYWVLHDRLDEPNVRLPFLMTLVAAAIQPVCFAYFWWLRIVMFFRFALVPMTSHLYTAIFCRREGNAMLALLEKMSPRLYTVVSGVFERKWFRILGLLIVFGVLFFWYVSELEGRSYFMAPIVEEIALYPIS